MAVTTKKMKKQKRLLHGVSVETLVAINGRDNKITERFLHPEHLGSFTDVYGRIVCERQEVFRMKFVAIIRYDYNKI